MVNRKRSAFTLAEVLITLGIIGVVAAMTLPALTAKYQKVATVTQLKKTYTTLSQAFTMAQKDYGDIKNWDFRPQNDYTSLKESLEQFAKQYLIPYLNVVTDCGVGKEASKRCFYTWYATDGTAINYKPSDNNYRFILNNTNLISLVYDNFEGNFTMGSILIYVDINGLQKPNTISKDVFVMNLKSGKSKFGFYGAGNSRDTLMNASTWGCAQKGSQSNRSLYCGALIRQDGGKSKMITRGFNHKLLSL